MSKTDKLIRHPTRLEYPTRPHKWNQRAKDNEKMLNEKLGEALAWWMRNCHSEKRMPRKHMKVLQEHGIMHDDGGDECQALEPLFSLIWDHGPELMRSRDVGLRQKADAEEWKRQRGEAS